MPQKNKALEKEIKARIKELNKQTGAKLSFTKLYEDIESALQPHMATSRDNELVAIYTAGISQLSDKMLTKHSAIVSNPVLRTKYKDDLAAKYSITVADTQMNDLIKKMMSYIDPDQAAGFFWSEQQLNAVRDFEYSSVKGRNRNEEWPKCLKEWDHLCFRKDIELIDKEFDPQDTTYKYNSRHTRDKDIKAAELYYKAKIVKDEVDGYGFFLRLIYRIFNSKMMNAYDAFIQKAKETLDRIGFDADKHGDGAETMLYGKTMPPHERDINFVESMRNKRSLETEEQVLKIRDKLFNDAKADMERAVEEYNKEHGTNLSHPSEEKAKTDKNNGNAVDNKADKSEKKENPPKKDEAVDKKVNNADKKVNNVDKKEDSVKNENKNIPKENIPKSQDDVIKEDPVRNKIDILDDEDAILPFGDAPDIKVELPPKKGIIKKFFGKK